MKNLVVALMLALIILSLHSCKKSEQSPHLPANPTIIGRWSLVTDSAVAVPGGTLPANPVYIGKPTDYYDFEADGKLSWSEQSITSDSSRYELSSDNKQITITLAIPNVPPVDCDCTSTYQISLLTTNKMILTNPPEPSGGGLIGGEKITLRR